MSAYFRLIKSLRYYLKGLFKVKNILNGPWAGLTLMALSSIFLVVDMCHLVRWH